MCVLFFFFHYCPSAPLLSEVQFMGNPITDGCPVNCKWRCTLTYPFPWHDCWLCIPIVALILSLLASAPSAVSAPVDCSLSDTPSTCTCIVMPFVSGKHLVPGTSAFNQHEFVIHLLQSSMVVQRWAEGGGALLTNLTLDSKHLLIWDGVQHALCLLEDRIRNICVRWDFLFLKTEGCQATRNLEGKVYHGSPLLMTVFL